MQIFWKEFFICYSSFIHIDNILSELSEKTKVLVEMLSEYSGGIRLETAMFEEEIEECFEMEPAHPRQDAFVGQLLIVMQKCAMGQILYFPSRRFCPQAIIGILRSVENMLVQ